MKKVILYVLVLFQIFLCYSVCAEESAAKAKLFVSEPDSNGEITVSLRIYNAVFQGVQAAIAFNPEQVEVTEDAVSDIEIGEPVQTEDGRTHTGNILTPVQQRLDSEKKYFSVAAIVNLGQPLPNRLVNENREITADENGVVIFQIKCRKKTSGAADIRFAAGGFDETNPEGLILSIAGRTLPVQAEVVQEETGKKETLQISGKTPVKEKSETELRQERIQDTVILQIDNYAAAVNGALVWIDSENKAVMPYIKEDRTMVPLRFIAEALGAEVVWNEATQEIQISKENQIIKLYIGKDAYYINEQVCSLDAAPEIVESRTFVPLRAVSEAFLKHVTWIEGTKTVIIAPQDKLWDEQSAVEQKLLRDALTIMSPLIRDMK